MSSYAGAASASGRDHRATSHSIPSRKPFTDRHIPGAFTQTAADAKSADFGDAVPKTEPSQTPPRQSRRKWLPRTCRICLEVVYPVTQAPVETIPGILQPKMRVTYTSTDPALGRLISPCKCKGSSKYVHEGCLQSWRHLDPSYGRRNYWQCPTCGFRYRLERMSWGRMISSTTTQLVLTALVFVVTLFIMGFIADPIINFYLEPSSILLRPRSLTTKIEPLLADTNSPGWFEHFIKGLASLGLLGFAKVLITLSPWNWFNIRGSGMMGGSRGRGSGRDRLANISWFVVIIGVGTFLWAVYKGVRVWSRRTLEQASERVTDVFNSDDEDDS